MFQTAARERLLFFKVHMAARDQVLAMSPATMDRILAPLRARAGRKHHSEIKPGSLLKKHIPIRTGTEDIVRLGYLGSRHGGALRELFGRGFCVDADLHRHLQGWTQCRAVWNKGHSAIHQQLQATEAESPFPWVAFDCDNGSEFLNYALWDH